MDRETAKEIVDTLEGVNRSIFGLLPRLQQSCSEDEFNKLKREIARISNVIDMNLYPVVLDQYPELDPLNNNQ